MLKQNKIKDIPLKIEIYQTMNYDKFKKGSNRKTYDNHINKLVRSMSKYGFLKELRLLVTSSFFIIDGQHRLEAAKRLGINIIFEVSSLPHGIISELNRLQLKWKPLDYLDYYISENISHYIKFEKFWKSTGFSITSARHIALLSSDYSSKTVDSWRKGTFKFKNEKRSYEIAGYIKDFAPFIIGYHTKEFVRGFISLLIENDNYNHQKMINKLKINKHRFTRPSMTDFYYTSLKEIYHSK